MNYQQLFNWYEQNKRILPFRDINNPYYIWISEIMLQQTQVDTVVPYFLRFVEVFPTVVDLAAASLDDVLKLVTGIGYYRRFRLMHQAAVKIVKDFDGIFPDNYKDLISLPGIGRYSAGAISSIAFNLPHSALDGNVIRVLSRYFKIEDDMRLEKHRKKMDQLNQQLIEISNQPALYTQSVMELGATVCKPSNPKCEACPLRGGCLAYKDDVVLNYPKMSKLAKQRTINYVTFVIEYNHKYVFRKRNESLLEGFYEYIQFESESVYASIEKLEELALNVDYFESVGQVKHVFTHQIWQMDVYKVFISGDLPNEWEVFKSINDAHLAVAHQKVSKLLLT